MPGAVAIGNARSKSVKRTASAEGEGAVYVPSVLRILNAIAANNA